MSNDWLIKPDEIIFGCDWDYCNDHRLIRSLTDVINISIDEEWFRVNIYGTGTKTRCHDCGMKICNQTINLDDCPLESCSSFEICSLHDWIVNASTNEQCFDSKCIPEQLVEPPDEKYKVSTEIILYLAQNRSNFHYHGMNVYCIAKNCSRTTIFHEIRQQITVTIGNLTAFPPTRPPTTTSTTRKPDSFGIRCYNCTSTNITQPCTGSNEYSISTKHCRIYYDENHVTFSSVPINSTQSYIYEFPYIFLEQSIDYNQTSKSWIFTRDSISYGCNRNYCNQPRLTSSLLASIHLAVNTSWLNANVLATGSSPRDCDQCLNNTQCVSNETYGVDICPVRKCNSTCFLSNIYNHMTTDQQCNQSICRPAGNDMHRVTIQGILYLNRPKLKVEFWKVSIPCHASDCSRSRIFNEINDQLIVRIGDLNAFSDISTTTTSTPNLLTTATFYDRDSCNNSMLVPDLSGSCVPKHDAHYEIVDFLLNEDNTENLTAVATALTAYFGTMSSMNSSEQEQLNRTLTPEITDNLVGIFNASLTYNASTSFLACRPTDEEDMPIGILFHSGFGGEMVFNSTENDAIQSNLTAAAILSRDSILSNEVSFISILVIDQPPIEYYRSKHVNEKLLSSSIIVAKTQQTYFNEMNISIYFRVLFEQESIGEYYCAFYDMITSSWNESGCTSPTYNFDFQRYECSCNHLTSFALIWLPTTLIHNANQSLNIEDICSLLFQFISILCFLIIFIHSLIKRNCCVNSKLAARDLLPLISCASTILLFTFYIALVLIVYTRSESLDEKDCFLSAHILMFTVYFLLIFMFCAKTSVGFFNYLRFVRPLPPPSFQQLRILLFVSFLISIIYSSFAIGLSTNQSYGMTQLYPYRICWFASNKLHFFLTIPIGIFLFLNIIMILLLAKYLISHTRSAPTLNPLNKRTKMCVIVLLSSCMTQGVAWLLGPLISVINSTSVRAFTWLFIIFNGLEGLWSIILYIVIIRLQKSDVHTHSFTGDTLTKLSSISSNPQQKRKQ
ncbi:unnamed protein product [Adineta ricciae]|uniref:G-protein coupled receptors family 2 profile 2 domain-containing protein n=1 Tax=Adineta ricciae TaxID=249248 RepID=A0A815QY42_ADIRI|nr:unnamed protein product [Adineta ricciae]CAF1469920.1 unnamed protein product [Adineta ricciae]